MVCQSMSVTAPWAGPAGTRSGDDRTAAGRGLYLGVIRRVTGWIVRSIPRTAPSSLMPSGSYPELDAPPGGGPGPSASTSTISLKVSWVIVPRRRDRDSSEMRDLSRILAITQALKIISE